MDVAPLEYAHLDAATRVLAEACPFDRAAEVAEEKLFGKAPLPAPLGPVLASPSPTSPVPTASTAPLSTPLGPIASPSPTSQVLTAVATPSTVGSAAASSGVATIATSSVSVSAPAVFGAFDGGELVGVASVCAHWMRVLAVVPRARRRGIGAALLDACIAHARLVGETRLRMLDQPGNYLAPGIDTRNTETIAWLEKRGFVRSGDPRCNVLVAVRDNPRVTLERAETAAAAARGLGYGIRRARDDERELVAAVRASFGGAWPWELERALGHAPPGVHVATKDGAYCAFAAHDGNNRGLGWFGPTGTWPEHRGNKLGEALLLACLVDVARDHERCEVAWIGPRPFYDKVAGIADERTFVAMVKELDGAVA